MRPRFELKSKQLNFTTKTGLDKIVWDIKDWVDVSNEYEQFKLDNHRPIWNFNECAYSMNNNGLKTAKFAQPQDIELIRKGFKLRKKRFFIKQRSSITFSFIGASCEDHVLEDALIDILYDRALRPKVISSIDLHFFKIWFVHIRPSEIILDLSKYKIDVLQSILLQSKVAENDRGVSIYRQYQPVLNERTGLVYIKEKLYYQPELPADDTFPTTLVM